MAEAIKVLAQADPGPLVLTDIYTVPVGAEVVVSTLAVCNRTGETNRFRVSIAPAGAPDDLAQYLFYDAPVIQTDSVFATVGLTLAASDVVRVYVQAYGFSFSLYGTEIT